jgi:hypothetical protein
LAVLLVLRLAAFPEHVQSPYRLDQGRSIVVSFRPLVQDPRAPAAGLNRRLENG